MYYFYQYLSTTFIINIFKVVSKQIFIVVDNIFF